MILHAKTGEGLGAKFGQALTVFLFTIVGDDDGAKEFVSELKRDKSLESMIYTSTDPLNKVMARLSQEPDTIGYKKYVSDNLIINPVVRLSFLPTDHIALSLYS